MADIHDDFENEQDLSKSFENETGAEKSDKDLLEARRGFDSFSKLSPKEHERLHDLIKKQDSDIAEGLGRGAAKGATLGFQEKLSAPVERAFAKVFGDEGTQAIYADKSDKDLEDSYKEQNAKAAANAPASYMLGQVAGSTPLAAVTGAAGNSLGNGIQGLTGLGNIASQTAGQATAGAALGATQGLGNSEGSLSGSPEERDQAISDMQKGAIIGGAVPLALGGAAGVANTLAGAGGQELANSVAAPIQEAANSQAVKSLEPSSSQLASMNLRGQTQKVGQTLLNNDLVPTLSSASKRAQGLQEFTNSAGEGISPAAQAVDTQAAKTIAQSSPEVQQQVKSLLAPQNLVDHIEEKVMEPLQASGDPANSSVKVQELLDKLGGLGDQTGGQLSFNNLNMFRQRLDKMINFEAPRGSDLQSTLKQFRTVLDDSLADTAQKIDSLSGTDLAKAFADTKANYASGIKATKLAASQEAKDSGLVNSLAGRTGAGAVAGKLLGNSGAGAALGAASKVVQSPAINRAAANTLNTVAGIVRQSPQSLGQYAAPLQNALIRGPEALSAMVFTLQQRDPEFQKKYGALLQSQSDNKGPESDQ